MQKLCRLGFRILSWFFSWNMVGFCHKRWDSFTMKHLDLTMDNTDSSMENTELPISWSEIHWVVTFYSWHVSGISALCNLQSTWAKYDTSWSWAEQFGGDDSNPVHHVICPSNTGQYHVKYAESTYLLFHNLSRCYYWLCAKLISHLGTQYEW